MGARTDKTKKDIMILHWQRNNETINNGLILLTMYFRFALNLLLLIIIYYLKLNQIFILNRKDIAIKKNKIFLHNLLEIRNLKKIK